eukprot:IDg1897t1
MENRPRQQGQTAPDLCAWHKCALAFALLTAFPTFPAKEIVFAHFDAYKCDRHYLAYLLRLVFKTGLFLPAPRIRRQRALLFLLLSLLLPLRFYKFATVRISPAARAVTDLAGAAANSSGSEIIPEHGSGAPAIRHSETREKRHAAHLVLLS